MVGVPLGEEMGDLVYAVDAGVRPVTLESGVVVASPVILEIRGPKALVEPALANQAALADLLAHAQRVDRVLEGEQAASSVAAVPDRTSGPRRGIFGRRKHQL